MSNRGQLNNRGRVHGDRGLSQGGRGLGQGQQGNRNCHSCSRGGHFFLEFLIRQCPKRFCQACGNKDHDQHNPSSVFYASLYIYSLVVMAG